MLSSDWLKVPVLTRHTCGICLFTAKQVSLPPAVSLRAPLLRWLGEAGCRLSKCLFARFCAHVCDLTHLQWLLRSQVCSQLISISHHLLSARLTDRPSAGRLRPRSFHSNQFCSAALVRGGRNIDLLSTLLHRRENVHGSPTAQPFFIQA